MSLTDLEPFTDLFLAIRNGNSKEILHYLPLSPTPNTALFDAIMDFNDNPPGFVKRIFLDPRVRLENDTELLIRLHWSPKFAEIYVALRLRDKFPVHLENSDIEKLSRNITRDLYPIWSISNPKLLISKGYLPKIPIAKERCFLALEMYYFNASTEDIYYWTGFEAYRFVSMLISYPIWTFVTESAAVRIAEATCYSFPCYLHNPSLLYKSNRPKTSMRFLNINNTIRSGNSIPVTRYARDRREGKYHALSPVSYLGTFYYYEKESSVHLSYNRAYISFNKTTAYSELSDSGNLLTGKVLEDHVSGILPADLLMSPEEVSKYQGKVLISNVSDKKRYAGVLLGLYSVEDYLDQKLCKVARDRGYDIVILRSMVGCRQIVTEILDCRDREVSFSNLYTK